MGEKLRNRRFELGLLQKDVAQILGVCEDSITYWENNRSEPSVCYYPKITEFLGYVPFEVDTSSLGGQIKLYRYKNGLSQLEFAKILGVDVSTVFHYEKNKHNASPAILRKMKFLHQDING